MSALGNPSFPPSPKTSSPVLAPVQPAAPPPAASKGWMWIAGLLVVSGVAGWLYFGRNKSDPAQQAAAARAAVKTILVSKGELLQTVRVTGLTASRSFVNVTAPIQRGPETGPMVLLFLVPSGARVKKGELVAQIDSKSVEDHIDDIADDIEQADSDVRKRQAEQAVDLENLNQTIRNAKASYDKAVLEAKAGEVRTEVERELLKLTVKETAARYKQVQADTQFKLAGYASEIKILGITKTRHLRHRARHQADLVRFKIFAPMDGLAVVQPLFRGGEMTSILQGDQLGPGQLFMKVVDPTKMVIEGNINQTESSAFRLGQKASIRFDAYPAMALTGEVDSIAALATKGWRENFYIRSLPVRVAIGGSDPKLIPDLSASADVAIGRVENATLLPLGAIHSEAGKEVVYVRSAKGAFERRTVEVGERNNTHAAIKSGLQVGEVVAIEKPAQAESTSASL